MKNMELAKADSTKNSEVTALIDALKKALSANDPAAPPTRMYLKETAEKLSFALENPGETVQRIAYYVSIIFKLIFSPNHLQLPSAIRLGR